MQHVFNYFYILYNILILKPPKNAISYNSLNNLWTKKIQPIKELYRDKNTIYNIIIEIKNIITNIIFNANNIRASDILTNIVAEKDKEELNISNLEKEEKFKLQAQNMEKSINMTLDYKFQLNNAYFKYEDELEDINICYKNNKIQYISIDLLIKKLCEDNSFNIEIIVNQETNQTFNFINAFIFQCFGFISYELIIF